MKMMMGGEPLPHAGLWGGPSHQHTLPAPFDHNNRIFTLQRPGRQDVFVHVVQVVGQDEVLRGRRSQAEEGRVQVEGRRQGRQARVGDQAETRQRLQLLPAVELLPQRRRHLG